jgi:hypothetical protein
VAAGQMASCFLYESEAYAAAPLEANHV